MQEETLIRLLKQQNEHALQTLIRTYSAYVSTIIRNVGRGSLSVHDTEEIAADVFLNVWQNAERLRTGALRSYLAVIARNLSVDRLRRLRFTVPIDEIELQSEADLTAETEQKLLAESVRSAIDSLQSADREILLRYYFYCEKLPQIADELSISETAAKTRLFRARKKLLAELTERGYQYEEESV